MATLLVATSTHLAARGGGVRLAVSLVIATLAVLVAHDRVVLFPWTGVSSIALDPIAPAAYVLPALALVETRRFTLEPAVLRERLARLGVLLALLLAVAVSTASVGVLHGVDAGILALRAALFFLGTTLALARLGDARLAATGVSVVAWVVGWLGSPGGPLEPCSWLAFPAADATSWSVCLLALGAGLLADLTG